MISIKRHRHSALVSIIAALGFVPACAPPGIGPIGDDTSQEGDNVLISDALGFGGTLSGKIADSQSTRGATSEAAAQEAPPDFDTDATIVAFTDVAGNDLLGADGLPIPPVPLDPDGTFNADNLPVGTDFTICADIGDDGTCDIESCINIPATAAGEEGELDGAQADPLTTIVLAKLRQLIEERGINARDPPFSPAVVVARIVAAYTNLFEDAGIDGEFNLEQIAREELDRLFDEIVPSGAKQGLRVVEGNLDLARRQEVTDLALAAAKVFLRAGFPIADLSGPPDLSALGTLDDVISVTPQEFFARGGQFNEPEDFSAEPTDQTTSDDDFFVAVAQIEDEDPSFTGGELIYLSTVVEIDLPQLMSGLRDLSSDQMQEYKIVLNTKGVAHTNKGLVESLVCCPKGQHENMLAELGSTSEKAVVIIWGCGDRLFPISQHAERFRYWFKRATFASICDAGHVPQEETPEAAVRILLEAF